MMQLSEEHCNVLNDPELYKREGEWWHYWYILTDELDDKGLYTQVDFMRWMHKAHIRPAYLPAACEYTPRGFIGIAHYRFDYIRSKRGDFPSTYERLNHIVLYNNDSVNVDPCNLLPVEYFGEKQYITYTNYEEYNNNSRIILYSDYAFTPLELLNKTFDSWYKWSTNCHEFLWGII